jgi:hypothetical protein
MACCRAVAVGAITVVLLASLTGCARYYWSKPGSTQEQFARDSADCANEAAANPTAAAHGIVSEPIYRACLSARGYAREKQFEPAAPGSYRGIEN